MTILATLVGFIGVFLPILVEGRSDLSSATPTWVLIITGAVGGVVTAAAVVVAIRLFNRVRSRDVRIALTGAPRAGKTVFSVALFDALMTGRRGVTFTAESRTILSVYRAIRGMAEGEWPPSTPREVVNRYEGRIMYGPRTLVDLELGDSAGEYWADISDDGSKDADYLSYVVSSDAIAHVIPIDWLQGKNESYSLARDEAELRLAGQLSRTHSGAESSQHLLIVLSKMDLTGWSAPARQGLRFQVFVPGDRASTTFLRQVLDSSRGKLFFKMLDRLDAEFASVRLTFSSIEQEDDFVDESISGWIYEVTRRPKARRLPVAKVPSHD